MPELSREFTSEVEQLKKTFSVVPIEEVYDPAHFGNAVLTMVGPQISIRFLRERGQVFLELTRSDGEWVDGNEILKTAGLHPRPGQPLPISELVALLCSNFGQVSELIT